MAELHEYLTGELVQELVDRGYDFLSDIEDLVIDEEFYHRKLSTQSDNDLQENLDKIYNLYKSYVCKDSSFEDNLKKFFSEVLNINVV